MIANSASNKFQFAATDLSNHLNCEHQRAIDLRGRSQEATLEVKKAGVDVIVQATFEEGQWNGVTDTLFKVGKASTLGN